MVGTPSIAVPSLKKIAALNNYEIVAVGVFPDKKVGRKQIFTPCDVKNAAIELDLPIIELANKKDLETFVENNDFDLGIVIAFGMIFTQKVLDLNTFVNVHFSILPSWRGASPVQSAILNQQKTSGITWQKMVKSLDAGDVLWQKEYDIENKSTAELWNFFAEETADNFENFLDKYFTEKIEPKTQIESKATFCGKFQKSDGEICFAQNTAKEIWHKYLAFDPWPGIFVNTERGDVKLKKISLSSSDESVKIMCQNSSEIFVEMAQIPGKKAQPIIEILNGNPEIFKIQDLKNNQK